jgi:FlaA1/EpsC-like NDP-sugar epimerase
MPTKKVREATLRLPRQIKRGLAVAMDSVLCALAVWAAFYLRLDQWAPLQGVQWLAIFLAIVLAVPIFVVAGLYRAIFRYSEASALARIAQAALVYGVLYATIFTFIRVEGIPRTVGIIQPVLLFLFVAFSRVLASWWLGGASVQLFNGGSAQNVMIYGAGSAGRQLHRALKATEMRVVGFIDDDARLHGQLLFEKPVHSPVELRDLVERYKLTDILLALPSASRKRRNEILEVVLPLPVAVRTVPGLTDLAQGRVHTSDIRELSLDDLLGREPVAPDDRLLAKNIRGKVVLVTGAGGSIGSELCRQVLVLEPSTLLLIEISEVAVYSIHKELENSIRANSLRTQIIPLLASVCDMDRMRDIMATWQPDTIYHSAAYKHVPLVEHNPAEGVWNNVFGTLAVANAAMETDVSDFVFVSTDKAVRPTNVMGTSKRLAEQILQALSGTSSSTRFSMVRFGNVLGSSGSVVPLFREQIRTGGPIRITHEEITRYFMTIPEAAQLVIQAGAMATGGEVYVLDMREPVKIIDLARKMVELSGLRVRDASNPDGDIDLLIVGLRPGEKLYEELLIGNNPELTSHPRIMKANEAFIPWPELRQQLDELRRVIEINDVATVVRLLQELVPEYTTEGGPVDWVYLQRAVGQPPSKVGGAG